jgi:hypothetical protein
VSARDGSGGYRTRPHIVVWVAVTTDKKVTLVAETFSPMGRSGVNPTPRVRHYQRAIGSN